MKELESKFKGVGEVKGFKYNRIKTTETMYVYSVHTGESTHFEVFERRTVPLCIDFEKRIYSETERKETYPKSNAFGVWAWTASTMKRAIEILENKTESKLIEQ
tara:strand:+ start:1855 stop:2166 length:312 start_codon:yes stop_codon:yes gene_type:complete